MTAQVAHSNRRASHDSLVDVTMTAQVAHSNRRASHDSLVDVTMTAQVAHSNHRDSLDLTMTADTITNHNPHPQIKQTPRPAISPLRLASSSFTMHRSFGSNDSGLQSNQSRYSPSIRGAASFSLLQDHTQNDATRPKSIPSLLKSHSCNLHPKPPGNNSSNRSSLYNTVRAEGFSITAV